MAEIIREVISVGYVVENGARRPLTDDESRKFARGLNEAFAATAAGSPGRVLVTP